MEEAVPRPRSYGLGRGRAFGRPERRGLPDIDADRTAPTRPSSEIELRTGIHDLNGMGAMSSAVLAVARQIERDRIRCRSTAPAARTAVLPTASAGKHLVTTVIDHRLGVQ
ncbi:hypothetical protein ACFV4Q_03155 [Streptomyces nojiriensis]|uniref:hypothetical protein n=1 Tax=Streptomyces nojiriensis TaxID=66374 RepID=UPI003657334D